MAQPRTSQELFRTLESMTHGRGLILTPVTGMMPGDMTTTLRHMWNGWEYGASGFINGLTVNQRISDGGQVMKILDSVAREDITNFSGLADNMPQGARR